jgi:tetratricopeptide (TPR) repeat protein
MSNRVARILDKLREQGSCLIVFDGVVDYAHLDKFFVKAKGNFHIITSRVPAATIPTMNSQGILPMTETEAISLFYMTVTPRTNPPGLMEQGVSDSSVQKLVRRMSCLPGAIHLAGLGISQEHGGLREYSLDTVIQNYCSRLEDDPSEEAKTLGPIFESWKPSMDKLEEGARRGEELFKNALEILYFLTFVNGKGFELRMFETYQKNIREADETDQHRAYGLDTMRTKSDLRELKAAADKLCSLGFIIMNGGSQLGEVHLQYAMSTMIQSVARQSLKDKPFEYHKHKAIATLVDTIPLKEDKDSEEVRRALVPHVESIFQLLGPKDLESLASKITMTLDAESHALQGNLDDPMRTINITDYMLQFSRILSDYGRIQESNDLRQEAVKRLDKAVKDDTVTPVDSRLRSQQLVAKEALASSQMVDGEFHAALEAREFIVECRKAELPNEETELLRAQANLAQSYYCLGHKEKSFTIREIVYQARTATQFGGGVYERVQSMRALATSHFSMGRRPEALELRQEALELGQDLSALIVTDMMSELAESLEDDGQVLAARELLKEVLKRCQSEQSRGSLHHARVALAHSDTLLGDPDKARELLREESLMEPKETYTNRESELQFQAAKIKARLGDVIFAKPALEGLHNATDNLDNKLHIMETLATMETDGGERLRIRREILKQAEESWGIHSRDTLLARYRIGNSHLENGEYLKAESIYKEVCDLQEKHLFSRKAGEKVAHPDVMKTKAKLAETYRRLYYQDEGSCSTASRSENSDPSSLCSPDDLQAVRNASGTSRGAGVTLSASLPALAELENGNGAAFELDFKFSANDNDRWRELSASLRKEVVDQRRFILGEENRHTLDAMEQLIETYANDGKIGMAVDLFTKIVQARRSRIGPFHPKTQLAEEDLRQLSATLPRPLDLANVEPICDESMSRAEEELQRLSVTLESRPTATDAELVSDDLMSGRERRRQGRVAARWKAITWKSLRWP